MPRCARCSRDGRTLYRANPLGEKGVFMCEECLPLEAAPDPELQQLMDALEGRLGCA